LTFFRFILNQLFEQVRAHPTYHIAGKKITFGKKYLQKRSVKNSHLKNDNDLKGKNLF
jgi:hypothetical protein